LSVSFSLFFSPYFFFFQTFSSLFLFFFLPPFSFFSLPNKTPIPLPLPFLFLFFLPIPVIFCLFFTFIIFELLSDYIAQVPQAGKRRKKKD
jgi:hypothetical protein